MHVRPIRAFLLAAATTAVFLPMLQAKAESSLDSTLAKAEGIVLSGQAGEQSIANAHVFLNEIFRQQSITVAADFGSGFNSRHYFGIYPNERRYNVTAPDHRVLRVSRLNDCSSQIAIPEADYNWRPGNLRQDNPLFDDGKMLATTSINWRGVSEVRQSGNLIFLVGGLDWGRQLRFRLPSDATAARVAYAMEFLRLGCDPTNRTGF